MDPFSNLILKVDCIQYFVITNKGKESEKKDIYVYV